MDRVRLGANEPVGPADRAGHGGHLVALERLLVAVAGCTALGPCPAEQFHRRRVPAGAALARALRRCTQRCDRLRRGSRRRYRAPPQRWRPTAASLGLPVESPQPPQHREARNREHTHRHRAQQQKNAIGMTNSAGRVRQPKQVRREEPEQERQRDRMCGRLGRRDVPRRMRRDGAPDGSGGAEPASGCWPVCCWRRMRSGRSRSTAPAPSLHDPGHDDNRRRRSRRHRRRRRMRDVRPGRGLGGRDPVCACSPRRVLSGVTGSAAPATLGTKQLSRNTAVSDQRPEWGGRASGPRTSVRLPPVPMPLTSWSCAQRPFQLSASYSANLTIRLFVSRINDMRAAALSARAESRG